MQNAALEISLISTNQPIVHQLLWIDYSVSPASRSTREGGKVHDVSDDDDLWLVTASITRR